MRKRIKVASKSSLALEVWAHVTAEVGGALSEKTNQNSVCLAAFKSQKGQKSRRLLTSVIWPRHCSGEPVMGTTLALEHLRVLVCLKTFSLHQHNLNLSRWLLVESHHQPWQTAVDTG